MIPETTFNRKAGRIPLKMRVMTAEGNQHKSLEFRCILTFLTKHYLISEVGDKLTEVLKLDKSGGKA